VKATTGFDLLHGEEGRGPGLITLRAHGAHYDRDVVATGRRCGARFSVIARMDKAATRAISGIPEDSWVPIKYRHAIFDEDEHRWVSGAQVAEITSSAFTLRRESEHTGLLSVWLSLSVSGSQAACAVVS